MANQIIVQILGDPSQVKQTIKSIEDGAEDSGKIIQNFYQGGLDKAFSDGLLSSIKSFGAIATTAIVAFTAVKEAIGGIFKGEELEAVDAQFALLAQNAGIAGDSLKSALEQSSKGLVEETELLKAANMGMVQLGSTARQLPELMDLARKATLVFGGSLIENFEAMERAVAAGNSRQLRHLGIIVDQTQALKEFAKEQGVSVSSLTLAGRQQAIMNAALEKGQQAFAGISGDLKQNTNNWQEFKVAISDAADILAKKDAEIFGPIFAKITGAVASMAKSVATNLKATFSDGFDGIEARKTILETQLGSAMEQLESLGKRAKFDPLAKESWEFAKVEVDRLRTSISLVDEELRKHQSQARAAAQGDVDAAKAANKARFFDPEKVASDRAKVQAEQLKGNTELINEEMKFNGNLNDIRELYSRQVVDVIKNTNAKEDQIKREFYDKGLVSFSEYNNLILQQEKIKNEKIHNLQLQSAHAEDEITKTTKNGIVNGLTTAFAGLGKALVTSGNGFAALSGAVISAIGAIAIQMGSLLVTMGLGFESIGIVMPAWAAAGAGAVIEGLALITLGGALEGVGSNVSGGSSGAGGGGAGGSGGIGGASNAIADNTPTQGQVTPGTTVQVQVLGNVFDNRQTGLAIVDAINNAFQQNGALLLQVPS